jgi:hypothetical protein
MLDVKLESLPWQVPPSPKNGAAVLWTHWAHVIVHVPISCVFAASA